MNDVVERVARAIGQAWLSDGDSPNWLPPIEFTDAELAHLARAAIEAMREPTEAMIAAAWVMRSSLDDAPTPGKMFADLWRTMLSAALADASPDIGKEGIGNDG